MRASQMAGRLGNAHDRATAVSFQLAQFCLLVIVSSYCYETVARYFFAAPTSWSNELVAYALCIGVFLAFPKVTSDGGHIAITFLTEKLPPGGARRAAVAIAVCSGLVCLFVAWICLEANIRHIQQGTQLVRVQPIPKIWISVWLTYGFASAGIHFLRAGIFPATTDTVTRASH